jgi:hypothetical protein
MYCRLTVEDSHEPQLKVKDENVGWKHTCSRCSHAGFERIGSRSGYNPVEDIYILQRPSSCDPHFRYSEFFWGSAGTMTAVIRSHAIILVSKMFLAKCRTKCR